MNYPDNYNPMIADFKLFHMNIYDSARFAAKIHFFEYDLPVEGEYPDEQEFYELDNPQLDDLLKDYYTKYEKALIKAIQDKSLKVAHLEIDIEDNIDVHLTWIEIHTLADWLEHRGSPIWGDYFEEYQSKQFELYWIAENAIKAAKLKKGRINLTDETIISHLNDKIEELEKEKRSFNTKPQSTHALTKAKNSLMLMLIAMAIRGYGYDPKAKRTQTVSEIKSDMNLLGLDLDEDTIREWLKKSAELLPPQEDNQ